MGFRWRVFSGLPVAYQKSRLKECTTDDKQIKCDNHDMRVDDNSDSHSEKVPARLSHREANELEFFDEYYEDMSKRRAVLKFYSVSEDTHNRHMRILLKDCEGKKVLEYGCGLGVYIYDLARAGAEASGFDVSAAETSTLVPSIA